MKKSIVKLFGLLALTTAVMTSCNSDDDSTQAPSSSFVLNPESFQGNIEDGNVELKSNVVYKLTGAITVKDGATLTIPAGTVIQASGGTSSYIAVAQGGKIFVNGTATNPVVMTSANPSPTAGNWGGLVICGKAPINRGAAGATAAAEVSNLTYGGSIANDNSGTIKYLRIEYSGAAFNSEKEYNGLSLFGVGSGTTVEYVQIYKGNDDGFEFFGGTVNTSHLVVTQVDDDAFDWTEGWNGTNQNWYAIRSTDPTFGNRGIEGDNFGDNHLATPIAKPTINNLTLIGAGANGGEENDGIKLRAGTKAIMNNVIIMNYATGINIEHDPSLSFIGNDLKITNVKFVGVTTKSKGKNTAGVSQDASGAFTESSTATGAGGVDAGYPTWAQGWTKQ